MLSKRNVASLAIFVGVLVGAMPGASVSRAFADDTELELLRMSQPVARRFRRNLPRNHDRGALVRVSVGVGYAKVSSDTGSTGFETSGLGMLPSIAVGWLPYERVGLHLSGWGVLGGDATAAGFGPGVTYYFDARENTWVSAAIGPMIFDDLENDGIQWGLAGEIEAGLYGWTADRWSMGASLFAGLEGFDLDRDGVRPWGWALGFRLGVVYN